MEAEVLITHAPAIQRERLQPNKPDVDGTIPLDLQKAALYDLFGGWAVQYAGGVPFVVEGPPSHPGVVTDYKYRVNRFISGLTAPIYKNLSNRVASLLKSDEEIATSLHYYRVDIFEMKAKMPKPKALTGYALLSSLSPPT